MCKQLTTFVLLTISLLVQPLLLSSVFAAPSPDFDGDGRVGFPDFLLFIGVYGSSRGDGTYQGRYDLDGDGVIGFPDFLIFVDNFGKEVSSGGMAVSIPDANLRAVIADNLSKERDAPITIAEMATLNDLIAVKKNIRDLTGLEYAINLTELNLLENKIEDVSSLSGLTNLTELYLFRNSITDLLPLVANTGLGSGDKEDVRNNPLNDQSRNVHIPALQSRGVTVRFGASKPAVEKIERGMPRAVLKVLEVVGREWETSDLFEGR